MRANSLSTRYLFKVASSVFQLLANLVIHFIVPRSLGPALYGQYNFLTEFFRRFTSFFDGSLTLFFFTRLSQNPRNEGLARLFFFTFAATAASLVAFVALTLALGKSELLWPHQPVALVWMGLIWAIVQWLSLLLSQLCDALGVTIRAEIARVGQKTAGVVVVLGLFFAGRLSLENYFYYQYATLALLVALLGWVIWSSGFFRFPVWRVRRADFSEWMGDFRDFNVPLISMAAINLAFTAFDFWWLEKIGGNTQQGFFGLANQLSIVCSLFLSSITPLIQREFALAVSEGRPEYVRQLFRQYVPAFYTLASFIVCFVVVEADQIIAIVAGNQFVFASTAVRIMSLYSIHQVYGQFCSSVLLAKGATATYRNISVASLLLGFPLSYLLIAPSTGAGIGGLGLGATGLALKMVLLHIFTGNAQLFVCSRYLQMKVGWFVRNQLTVPALFIGLSLLVRLGFTGLAGGDIVWVLVRGGIYALAGLVLVLKAPALFGLDREALLRVIGKLKGRLRSQPEPSPS